MKYRNILYSSLAGLLLFASCTQTHENAEQVSNLPNMYPDYADVTIPVNIAPLNFEIRDKHLTNIETILTIEGADANDAANTLTATSNSQNLKFDMKDWKAFLQKAVNKNIKVQIYSKSDEGDWTAFKPFTWQVVSDSIDSYLTYRLIEPDYEVWNKIQIKQRCIENWEEKILADHNLQENRCMNCHAFGNQNPNLSMLYVRGEGGGAILNRNGKLRKLNLKNDNLISSSVYYGFCPSGKYVTFSTNIIIPAFHANADKRLEVYDSKSDTYHSWSHTGRWFVFASKRDDGLYGKPYFCYVDRQCKAHKPFVLPQKEPTFYDDCLKSFNIPELSRGPVPFDAIDIENVLKQKSSNKKKQKRSCYHIATGAFSIHIHLNSSLFTLCPETPINRAFQGVKSYQRLFTHSSPLIT